MKKIIRKLIRWCQKFRAFNYFSGKNISDQTITIVFYLLLQGQLALCAEENNKTKNDKELYTNNGRHYQNITITKVEPDGIRIRHEHGAGKILFDDLSPELQKKFNYDKEKAKAFRAQEQTGNIFNQKSAKPNTSAEIKTDEVVKDVSELVAAKPKGNPATSLNKEQLYDYIMGITNGWKGDRYFFKSERQKQILFRDITGKKSDVFFSAIADINRTFGYEKLLPQLSATNQVHDQTVVVFYGPKRDGREFLREAGAERRASCEWSCWFWLDQKKELKGIIAIYEEDVDSKELPYYLRQSLLTAMGYPGRTDVVESVFNDYQSRHELKKLAGNEFLSSIITPYDKALLVFCDRYFVTDSSRGDIRIELRKNWWDFITKFELNSDTKMDSGTQNR